MKTPMLVGALLVVATAAAAQEAQPDPRFAAWYGCWKAMETAAPAPGGKTPTVCVIPSAGGAEVLTVVDSGIVARDTLVANPERHQVAREGCAGWETATWSSQGDRLYRRSEYACPGDIRRIGSEVIAMSPEWEWLDVQGLAARGEMGVRTLRYRAAAVPAVAEIETALGAPMANVSLARGAAATPPTLADVIEASRAADPAVVEAWLAEEGVAFSVNGKGLAALADSGVPPRVIDVMVAMDYPQLFTVVAPSGRGTGVRPTARPPAPDTMYAQRNPYGRYDPFAPPYGWAWDYYSPWSWSMYGYYSPFYYSPYGYSPYWYGAYPGDYGGYYTGYYGGPVIIVNQGNANANPPAPHGRIVKGKGYDYSGTSASGTTSTASQPSSQSAPPPPPPSSSSSSGSSGQAGQHAKPKP